MKTRTLVIGLIVITAFAALVFAGMKNDSKEAMMDKVSEDHEMMESEETEMMEGEKGVMDESSEVKMNLEAEMMMDEEVHSM